MQPASTLTNIARLAACVALAACSDSSAGFDYDEAAIRELAAAYCECGPLQVAQECEEIFARAAISQTLPAVQAGRVVVGSQADWDACIAQLRSCDESEPHACESVLSGTLREGEACVNDGECADGLRCSFSEQAASCALEGVCTPVVTEPRGAACDFEDSCEGDHVCGPDDARVETICQPRLAAGEPCRPMRNTLSGMTMCETGLTCIPDADGQPVCGEPLPIGESCEIVLPEEAPTFTVNGGFYPNPCVGAAFCNVETFVCESVRDRELPPSGRAQRGEPCLPDSQVEDESDECDSGLVCVAARCQLRKLNGEPCAEDDECAAACVDGRCAPAFEACSE